MDAFYQEQQPRMGAINQHSSSNEHSDIRRVRLPNAGTSRSSFESVSARSLLKKSERYVALATIPKVTYALSEDIMAAKTLNDLFIHALSDIYSAEKQLTKALPKLARASTNPELRQAFETHLEETHGQIERIDQVVESCGIKLQRLKCVAMEGLVEEGQEQIGEIERGPVLDAAIIGAARKAEHYEIAAYGTLAALGKQLGQEQAVKLLLETLEEEKATDNKLTILAEQKISPEAASKS
jgi:ferritin-like metal-binding protein YciE